MKNLRFISVVAMLFMAATAFCKPSMSLVGKIVKVKSTPTPLSEFSDDYWYVMKSGDKVAGCTTTSNALSYWGSSGWQYSYSDDFVSINEVDGKEAKRQYLVYTNTDGQIPKLNGFCDNELYQYNGTEINTTVIWGLGSNSTPHRSLTWSQQEGNMFTVYYSDYSSSGNIPHYLQPEATKVETTSRIYSQFWKEAIAYWGFYQVELLDVISFKSNLILAVGQTGKQNPTITLTGGTVTNWASSDESVATVDSEGNVTGVAVGTATITATASDSNSSTASYTVYVIENEVALDDGTENNIDVHGGAIVPQITYTRNFTNTEWQALYVPFDMQYSDWSVDFEVARINDVHQFDDDDNGTIDRTTLEFFYMPEGSHTTANVPYLILSKTADEKTITLTNVTLYPADENSYDVSSWNTLFTFTGTYSAIPAAMMVANGWYALGGGSLIQSNGSNELKPYRWYMAVTDRNGVPKDIGSEVKIAVIGWDGMEEETGIVEMSNVKCQISNDRDFYDLSGRRISPSIFNSQPSILRRGIYIHNGKKVVIGR